MSAQDATWFGGTPSAASSDYFVSSNWTPATVPTGIATFGASANTNISFGSTSTVGGWTFSPGASAYTITVGGALGELDFTGAGITVNGGSATIINNFITQFHNSSSAGAASITNNFALDFWDTSSAGSANITTTHAIEFFNNSSPGSAAITATGPLASVRFDFTSGLNGDYKLTVGSIAGDGTFNIGHNQLTVGSNNLSTTVDGLITDGGFGANGSLVKVGTGTLTLTAANSYAGGTTVSDGILQVGHNSAVGTGTVTLDGGLFQADGTTDLTIANNFKINNTLAGGAIDANGVALTIGGNISDGVGAGKLTVLDSAGGGVLILAGTNTYSGGTTICFCGTLQLGDATHTGSMVGDITNEGLFNVVNANTTGITSLTNDGGLTTFNNTTSAATIAITNKNGGGTEFFDSSSAGSATIVNRTGGVTIFSNTSTAADASITNRSSGVTVFTDNSTAGNATITTLNGAETLFFVAATGGNAQFITNGSGVVDFSGTTGPNGDGRISAGSIAGSGSYLIGAGNTLVVGSNNLSTEVSGVIADSCGCGPGAGSLEKVGSGTLTLSGANVYTGTTTVNGGVLQVDGSIASSILTTANAGGALTGIGTVGNTMVANGGIFLPGNGTPGTSMTVAGNLAFQSGALYLVALNSTSSSFAAVTGNAALNGTVVASLAPGSTVRSQYTIMQVGSATGNFAGVAAPGGLVGTTTQGAGVVYLNFALDYGAKNNLNINQSNVATTLQNFFKTNGGLSAIFIGLGPGGLTQASGESGTGSQQTTFNAMNQFLGLLTDVFNTGRSGTPGATPYADETNATAYAATRKTASDALASIYRKAPTPTFEQRWDVWAAGYGGSQTTDGNAALGSNNTSSSVYGTAVGLDYRFSPSTIAGFALAGGGTGFNVNGLGWGRSDLFQAGAFVRHNAGPAYVTAALAYGWQDVTTNRIVTAAGTDQLRAQFNANAVSGRIEGGYRQATQWIGLTPYAAVQATMFSLPSYSEFAVVGSNNFALNYAAKDVTSTRIELGLRADRSFAAAGGVVTLRGRAAWAHDFNPDRTVGAVFQALPGSAFVVNGAAQARDSALTTASVQMNWMNGWSAALTFEGEFSNVTRSYAGKGVVRYAW
ncbi:autotransporter domain-containing protein [Bradyrhizobium rifense]|uniref:Autotransporter domain-containing protein n=1 Tax=Bradyrhizobium rifense TaxID=515499 RepID=A0A5D3K0Y6_9BRAD|nr:autotransporter domain-containing protein [Bradyrhizobium rifense]